MSEKSDERQFFESLMKIKERKEKGEVGGSEDPASGANIDQETPELTEEELKKISQNDSVEGGPIEDGRPVAPQEHLSNYAYAAQEELARSMYATRPELEKSAPIEEQRNKIRAAIQNWKYIIPETNLEEREKIVEELKRLQNPDLIVEEFTSAIEKDPENTLLKEFYERVNPHA